MRKEVRYYTKPIAFHATLTFVTCPLIFETLKSYEQKQVTSDEPSRLSGNPLVKRCDRTLEQPSHWVNRHVSGGTFKHLIVNKE